VSSKTFNDNNNNLTAEAEMSSTPVCYQAVRQPRRLGLTYLSSKHKP